MTNITLPRATVEQALEALKYLHEEKCNYMRRNNLGDPLRENAARLALPAITALRAALAQQAEPVAADALTEPKSGDKWRVEWWNESCRMMLPAHAKLDSFVAYKNGTIQFTIKRTAA